MSKLNNEYFETKKKYKNNLRSRTIKEKIFFIIFTLIIAFIFIIYNLNKNSRQETIEALNSLEIDFVENDTIVYNNPFSILVPKDFGFKKNYNNFLIYSRNINDKDYIFFVVEKDLIEKDLIKSYKHILRNSQNKYTFKSKTETNDFEVLEIFINKNSRGLVKLIKFSNDKLYIIHVSSPINIWDEKTAERIINSFKFID